MTYERLAKHDFCSLVFHLATDVLRAEYEYAEAHSGKGEYSLDEYEFYIERVGNRLSLLLSMLKQLHHTILYFSNFRLTPSLKRAGIDRSKHLRYNIENYFIRIQTIYDIILKLIDAVFHLTNEDKQCRYSTIMSNLKVKQSRIPSKLAPITKAISKFTKARHSVVHGSLYQDNDLYRIELYSNLIESYASAGDELPKELSFVPRTLNDMIKEFIRDRKKDYEIANREITNLIFDLFDELLDRFNFERRRIAKAIK